MRDNVLIVPTSRPGNGGGHLTRCARLTLELRASGREAWLRLPALSFNVSSILESINFNTEWLAQDASRRLDEIKNNIEFIVLDNYQTQAEELFRWKEIAPVVGVDEGGKRRDSFDFLIDILIPEKLGKPSANITSPALLFNSAFNREKNDSPGPRRKNDISPLEILITFGQEDSAGLGPKTAIKLSSFNNENERPLKITLLKGALSKWDFECPPNARVIQAIPNLAGRLAEYDLVITHYGVTAYEALYAGSPVLLAHPTPYHKKLARAAGFYSIDILFNKFQRENQKTRAELNSRDSFLLKLKNHQSRALAEKLKLSGNVSLAELVNSFAPVVNRFSTYPGLKDAGKSAARFTDRTYRSSGRSGIIHMDRINPAPVEYAKEYFFESYKKQYGKTYLEDFDNIKETGKRRLKIISRILRAGMKARKKNNDLKPALLDIGCAYGPFLAAAGEEGYSPTGIDPSRDAVLYAREKLGVNAVQGYFPVSRSLLSAPYDAITLWYVIEHFQDHASALAEIKNLLKPDGVIAFSTPSFSGISGRKNPRAFLFASPADHFTVWSPKTAKKTLSRAGFKVAKIVISGHHPERFPVFGKFAKNRKNLIYRILLAISEIFKLGDTFEIYARKK